MAGLQLSSPQLGGGISVPVAPNPVDSLAGGFANGLGQMQQRQMQRAQLAEQAREFNQTFGLEQQKQNTLLPLQAQQYQTENQKNQQLINQSSQMFPNQMRAAQLTNTHNDLINQQAQQQIDANKQAVSNEILKKRTAYTAGFALLPDNLPADKKEQAKQTFITEGLNNGMLTPEAAQQFQQMSWDQLKQMSHVALAINNKIEDAQNAIINQRAIDNGSLTPTQQQQHIKNETEQRDKFDAESKTFKDQATSYSIGQTAIADPDKATPASDTALLYSTIKLMNPDKGIRQGQITATEEDGSMLDKIEKMYNNAVQGQKMSPEVRNDMIKQNNELFHNAMQQQQLIKEKYTNFAKQYGLNPSNIVSNYSPMEQMYTGKNGGKFSEFDINQKAQQLGITPEELKSRIQARPIQ